MKVPYKAFLTTALYCLLLAGASSHMGAFAQSQKEIGVKTIVIDAGHGDKDPGTVWGEYREKDINLKVAKLLGDLINKNLPDVRVIYTRETDVFIPLHERTNIANRAGADFFLSIHVNAVDKGKRAPSGAMTLVMGPSKAQDNLDVAMRENDVITYEEDYNTKYEGYEPGVPETYIMFSLMQYVYLDQSMSFADIMQRHFKQNTPMPDLGARQQNLLVLWRTAMPGVLIELGFLPNDNDRKTLTSADGQKKLATAIFNAFSEYKSKVEGKSQAIQVDVTGESGGSREVAQGSSGGTAASAGGGQAAGSGQAGSQTAGGGQAGTPATQATSTSGGGTATTPVSTATPTTADPQKVYYRIQISSINRRLADNDPFLRRHSHLGEITVRKVGAVYRYYVGRCDSFGDATALQARVREVTRDAFAVGFRGDEPISMSEARREAP